MLVRLLERVPRGGDLQAEVGVQLGALRVGEALDERRADERLAREAHTRARVGVAS